jgi:hypothetical protein
MLSRDPRMNKAATLQPPSPPGTPVASNPGGATGFNGLTHADQRNAGTGIYANTQFSLEPPDQGLCAGHGFVLESVNLALAVYNQSGTQLTAPTALNQFYKRSPAINRVTGVTGDFLSDPKCYWDPVGQRFIQTILEVDAPGVFNGTTPVNGTRVLIAVTACCSAGSTRRSPPRPGRPGSASPTSRSARSVPRPGPSPASSTRVTWP